MGTTVDPWPLIGVVVIIVGLVLQSNPMLVVAVAAVVIGFTASMSIEQILAVIGAGIIKTRALPLIILLPLAVVGLLKRHGLRERAQNWITRIQSTVVGRLLIAYLAVRGLTAAADLTGLGGHPQMARPLLALMAEGAAENRFGKLLAPMRERLLAFCAATGDVSLFFGKDIFVAFGTIALMHTFLLSSGVDMEPPRIAVWDIPAAVYAFLVHSTCLKHLDGRLTREVGNQQGATSSTNTAAAKQE